MPTHTRYAAMDQKEANGALWRALEGRGRIPGTLPGVAKPCGAQTSACSDWCRATTSRRKQGEAQAERERMVKAVRGPLGGLKSRKLQSATFTRTLPGAPNGEYVVLRYATTFEHKTSAVETVTPLHDQDSSWRVSGYYIK